MPECSISHEFLARNRPPTVERQFRLNTLFELVDGCRACPRMEGRRRVLSPLNGTAGSQVMFVAEAPGRNGADRTGVPIHGDPTGANFEKLLASVGWSREKVFVTNAVLCNPRDAKGNNDTPNDEELSRCSFHLEATIRAVDPFVVVTLGKKPLEALGIIEPHDFVLKEVVGSSQKWAGRVLFPLYHPSPRALIYRSFEKQKGDFINLAKLVNTIWRLRNAAASEGTTLFP